MSQHARCDQWTLAVLATLTLAACGPTEPTPLTPDVVGHYSGSWTRHGMRDGQVMTPTVCPASLTIVSQQGGSFRGDMEVSTPCARTETIDAGSVSGSGAITFRLASDPGVSDDPPQLCGPAALPAFRGTVAAGTISVTRTEALDCRAASGHQYEMTITLSLTR